jgi:hypothetical protein
MGCCKNILRTWVVAANLLFALSGVIIAYSAFTLSSPIDHIHGHNANGVLGMGVGTFILGVIGMISACKSDNGISRTVLCIYGTVLVFVCVASAVFGSSAVIFAGVMQGVEDGTFVNETSDIVVSNSTRPDLAKFAEQTEQALNYTWVVCCTGEIPEDMDLFSINKRSDHDDEEMREHEDRHSLRGGEDADFPEEWNEMSDEEKKEKMEEVCDALSTALENNGESLHCDDPDGFNIFFHETLQLLIKGLGIYGITMILASCVQFITMLASCCLVCAGSDHHVSHTTTHNVTVTDYRGANSHYNAMRSPLVTTPSTHHSGKETVVTGNPVF